MEAVQRLDAQPVTYEEYLAWPETTQPCEFVDGRPVVSPSPAVRHQVAAQRLSVALSQELPSGFVLAQAPLDWVISREPLIVRQPDIVVFDATQLREQHLTEAPLLAVEILSPATRERDVVTKRAEYAAAGLAWFWLVDLDVPQIVVLGNDDGEFGLDSTAVGEEILEVARPFPVRLAPADLI